MRERLLERIRKAENCPELRMRPDGEAVKRSIVSHISKIFNSSQGNTLIAEEFGVPDFSALNSMGRLDAIRSLEAILEETIRKFEPRLDAIEIAHIPTKRIRTTLRFTIKAVIMADSAPQPLVFLTVVNADGHIAVKG